MMSTSGTPWQLQMYAKSLKKRQKVELLIQVYPQPKTELAQGARTVLLN